MIKNLLITKIYQFKKFYEGLNSHTFIEIAWTVGPSLILMLPVVSVFAILYSIEEVYVEPSNDKPVSLNTVPEVELTPVKSAEVELTPVKSAEVELTPVKSAGLLEAVDTLDENKEKLLKAYNDAIFQKRVLVVGCVAVLFLGIAGWALYPYLVDYLNSSSRAPSPSSSSGSDSPVSFFSASESPPNPIFDAFFYMYTHANIAEQSGLMTTFDYYMSKGCSHLESTTRALEYGRKLGIGLAEGKLPL